MILFSFIYIRNCETLSLVRLPYLFTLELIGRIKVQRPCFDSDNLSFPCLVPHGACLLHHYCAYSLQALSGQPSNLRTWFLAYGFKSTKLSQYWTINAKIAQKIDGTMKMGWEDSPEVCSPDLYCLAPAECSCVAVRIVAQV